MLPSAFWHECTFRRLNRERGNMMEVCTVPQTGAVPRTVCLGSPGEKVKTSIPSTGVRRRPRAPRASFVFLSDCPTTGVDGSAGGSDASPSTSGVAAGAASATAAFPRAIAHEWTGPNPFPGEHQRRRPPAPQITQSVCRPRRGQPSTVRVAAAAVRSTQHLKRTAGSVRAAGMPASGTADASRDPPRP
ncbi:hypothetical protein IscW_ISCW014278 [Ixodes scapularis]|uniref:Uncharacterized protein n=1 Tax=Ixodes scapularis TaxID=6945 RepID=B7QKU8_IXOSC|nr:hypothetical protein IscW_ISCW014278 [Ixodes scapularis]|eukprot:XP_002415803.1 hypothetical protein IscW_ISCW014278 [Ixodes scapularis]